MVRGPLRVIMRRSRSILMCTPRAPCREISVQRCRIAWARGGTISCSSGRGSCRPRPSAFQVSAVHGRKEDGLQTQPTRHVKQFHGSSSASSIDRSVGHRKPSVVAFFPVRPSQRKLEILD